MFNLPPNIFNSPYLQNMIGQAKKQGWSEVNPFRGVSGIGHYGSGLNSSASQIYEHFSGGMNAQGRKYRDHGLKPIAPHKQIESRRDFNNRFNPQPPQITVPPPKDPVASGGLPNFNLGNFNFGNFNPSMLNGIFNTQPTAPMPSFPGFGQPQQMDRPMAMPSGGPAPRQAVPMPNMNAGIFNMPQFNRR